MASQAIARPVRTAGQLLPAGLLTEAIDVFLVDLDERQYAVALGLLTLLIGYIQIVVENKTGKGFLRQVPGPEVDVVEEDQHGVDH